MAIQAIASEVVRQSLFRIEEKLRDNGYKHNLYIVTTDGEAVDIRYPRLVESVVSGPIGGLMGCRYLGEESGLGSYLRVTDRRELVIGPESAESDPGPGKRDPNPHGLPPGSGTYEFRDLTTEVIQRFL